MLNTSQAMDDWQDYFGKPKGSKLGILNSIYQIGSIASFPFAYVISVCGETIGGREGKKLTLFGIVHSWLITLAERSPLPWDVSS